MPPITRQKLTKRFLFRLPEGWYIVRNCYKRIAGGKFVPCFQEVVSRPEEREGQWQRIKDAHADGRLSFVYGNREDHEISIGNA